MSSAGGIVNLLTVDVEEWFQGNPVIPFTHADRFESRVEADVERLLKLFAQYGVRATWFVLGYLAETRPRMVARIAAAGHEIGTHGYGHELITRQSRAVFAEELRRSVAACEDAAGRRVEGYRASNWSITRATLWALDEIAAAGLAYDSSIFPTGNSRYGIPDAPRFIHRLSNGLLEVPPSTWRAAWAPRWSPNLPCSGGCYLRVLPGAALAAAVRSLNRAGHPAVLYIHPWELDPDPPRHLPVPWHNRRIHYTGLATTAPKLRRLLGDFSFTSIAEHLARDEVSVGSLSESAR